MSAIALLVLLIAVGVVAGGVAFGVALARQGRRELEGQGRLLPGVETGAPVAWGGAHSPEAKLHRRLGAALQGLRAQAEAGHEGGTELELRVELEQQAIELDRRLVAAASLPEPARGQAIAEAEVSVAAIEQAAADLGRSVGQLSAGAQVRELEDLAARIRALGEDPFAEPPALPDEEPGGTTAEA